MKTINFTFFRRNASAVLDLVEKGQTVRILRHSKAIISHGVQRTATMMITTIAAPIRIQKIGPGSFTIATSL
jgi:antitoxin (DNA-binding transcriptional repressor) of toxin-antitoxin stability system